MNFLAKNYLKIKKIYHCGVSINHAESKTFSINKLEDYVIIESLINQINNIIHKK